MPSLRWGPRCGPLGAESRAVPQVWSSGWGVTCSPPGQFVKSFGTKGRRPGEFRYPNGLAVDNSGVVYVCDSHNGKIQLF